MDVSKTMTESFDLLLNRDRNINELTNKAIDLKAGAASFKDSSKKLKMSMYFKQYMVPILICAVFLIFLLLKWILF